MSAARVPAVGGQRDVPAPDPIARDYLLFALRMDQHISGFVDGYFGPADLKARVDMEPLRPPARLRDDALALRDRLAGEVDDPVRRDWLDAQVVAIATQAGALAGEGLPYVEHLRACFGVAPEPRDVAIFDAAAARLDELLPGRGPIPERLDAWDERFTIAPDRLPSIVDRLVAAFRERATARWGLPDGEDLRVSYVRGQAWGGYNWYDGGLRSRVDLNLDLPVRADALQHTVAHETYLGHHLEQTWREAEQVERRGWLEASVLLINTPECLVSEGLADLGEGIAMADGERRAQLGEIVEAAALDVTADEVDRQFALVEARVRLGEVSVNAALLRHADGRSHDEVLAYLHDVGRYPAEVAAKRLEFIEHPLWRTYVFVYPEGRTVLGRWLDAAPDGDRAGRFGRLLREPLTPAAITSETAAATAQRVE